MKHDLKEHALRRAGILSMSSAWGHDDDAAIMQSLVKRVDELEAQLAARDAEIAAWLCGDHGDWSAAGRKFANAIETGAHRSNQQ